jgi:hypothetical protein
LGPDRVHSRAGHFIAPYDRVSGKTVSDISGKTVSDIQEVAARAGRLIIV